MKNMAFPTMTPQKRPIQMNESALVASGRAIYQKSSCVFCLMVLLFENRLDLIDPVESNSRLQFNFAVQGSIVPNLTKYFQLISSRCTAGLNRASNAIAIFPLIHGLLLSRLETGNKADLSWQDIVLKSNKAGAATPNKMFCIPDSNKRQGIYV